VPTGKGRQCAGDRFAFLPKQDRHHGGSSFVGAVRRSLAIPLEGVHYAGELHGQLLLNLQGGTGNDTADVLCSLSAVSTGSVGAGPNSGRALVAGNEGTDRLTFRVLNPNPDDSAQVYADLDVDLGETFTKTPNVRRI